MSKYTCTGKVIDICPNCKNCKTVAWDGVSNIECEDPFDGMVKALTADSNLCCSMFELKPDHGRYPWGKDQNEPMYSELIKASKRKDELIQSYREEIAKLKDKYEKLDTHYRYDEDIIKDIQDVISPGDNSIWSHSELVEEIKDLKKSNEKLQNQIKNLQITNEESYKREEKLEDKVHRLEKRLHDELDCARSIDTNFLMPLTRVLYPGEKVGKLYSEILEDVKRLIDKNETLDKRNTNQFVLIGEKDKQFEELTRRYNMLAKKLNDIYVILKEGNDDE